MEGEGFIDSFLLESLNGSLLLASPPGPVKDVAFLLLAKSELGSFNFNRSVMLVSCFG